MSAAYRARPNPDPDPSPLSPSQRFLLEGAHGTYDRVAKLDFSQLSTIAACLEAARLRAALGEVLGLVEQLIETPDHRGGGANPS